ASAIADWGWSISMRSLSDESMNDLILPAPGPPHARRSRTVWPAAGLLLVLLAIAAWGLASCGQPGMPATVVPTAPAAAGDRTSAVTPTIAPTVAPTAQDEGGPVSGCQRPYANTSPWNTRIGSAPTYDPRSDLATGV